MWCCQPLARTQGKWSRSDADGKTENTVIKQLNVITSYRKHTLKKRQCSLLLQTASSARTVLKCDAGLKFDGTTYSWKKRWRLTSEELRTEWRLPRFDPEAITDSRLDFTRHYSFPTDQLVIARAVSVAGTAVTGNTRTASSGSVCDWN